MSDTLFENETANGDGDIISVRNRGIPGEFVHRTIIVSGTFDGATFLLKMRDQDGTWVNVPDSSLTAAGAYNVSLRAAEIRGNLASVGASTDITAKAV